MAEMAIEPRMGLNFEQVWAALMELRESQKESDRLLKESRADFDRCMQETNKQMQETDKEIKELSKNIGGLNNSLGKLIERMFSAQAWDKFDALDYEFTKGGNTKFIENKRILAEVDIFLENGEYAMPVEVKTYLRAENVDEHIERIERIRGYMDKRGDKRRLVGLCLVM
ncbi:MAG: hypothetical protein LBD93_05745 [Treponema sp.]|nr:hypothetical protein [Treponema sp.]